MNPPTSEGVSEHGHIIIHVLFVIEASTVVLCSRVSACVLRIFCVYKPICSFV